MQFCIKPARHDNLCDKLHISCHIINPRMLFRYFKSHSHQLAYHFLWVNVTHQCNCQLICGYLIHCLTQSFVKARIAHGLKVIVYRQTILGTFVLYYIICLKDPAYFIPDYCICYFLNNQQINPNRFFTEIIFPLEYQIVFILPKLQLGCPIKCWMPLYLIFHLSIYLY